MTFVGKILVILIMAFSLVFLGVSTVVFTTATNWKDRSEKQKTEIGKVQGNLRDADAKVKDAQGKLEAAKAEHTTQLNERNIRITDLTKQVADANNEMTQARSQLELAQKNAEVALAEATARKGEIDTLTETLAKAQTQANQFSTQNIELTDQIRIIDREKTTAEQNAKDLRKTVASFLAYAKKQQIPMDKITGVDPSTVAPDVEGRINQVDSTNRSMEISIGSDDGIAVGQELYVLRRDPKPEYLGKVRIVSVQSDKAVVSVIGKTVQGRKIQEGDNVSSSLTAR